MNMAALVLAALAVASLSACDRSGASQANYDVHEGDSYGYVGTENDDGVQRLHMFEYLGEVDGQYTFRETDSGRKISCTNPCKYVKIAIDGLPQATQRVVYEEDSAFSLMLDDAVNGRLDAVGGPGSAAEQAQASAQHAADIAYDQHLQAQAEAYLAQKDAEDTQQAQLPAATAVDAPGAAASESMAETPSDQP